MTTASEIPAQPLTIVYVGNFRRSWCTEVHVAGSLESLGHQVVRVQENLCDWAALPDLVDRHGAHLLLWTRTWPTEMAVAAPALAELRASGVPSASFHLDLFLGLDREHQVADQPFFATDLLLTPHRTDRWDELGVPHLWSPPGVYHAECGPVPANPRRWPYDVVFVGSHPYPHAEWEPVRTALIESFTAKFGDRFIVLPRPGQPLRGRLLAELYATVPIVLGDSCMAGQVDGYWSDRVPETLGRGGFLIHPRIGDDIGPGGAWYEHGEHLVTYTAGEPDEAVAAAADALADRHETARIAAAGRALVTSRDTYRHRMAAMLDEIASRFEWRTPPAAPPTPSSHPPASRVRVRHAAGGWTARFDPRPGDVDVFNGDFRVVSEVWDSNDYRVPARGFRGSTVVDIGANVGAFSVLAAKAGAGRVVAFEPHPANRARLVHHVDVNRCPQIEVDPRAVVGDVEFIPRVSMVGDGGGAHTAVAGDKEDGTAETVGLRDLLYQLAPIGFLKVDIEGAEYEAFDAVTAADLTATVEQAALEWHGPGMPHLTHLDDGSHVERWSALIAMLADCGRVETVGHPWLGGLIYWTRY